MPKQCDKCGGTGWLAPEAICICCRGKGKIFSKREREIIDFMVDSMKACEKMDEIRKGTTQNAGSACFENKACRGSTS